MDFGRNLAVVFIIALVAATAMSANNATEDVTTLPPETQQDATSKTNSENHPEAATQASENRTESAIDSVTKAATEGPLLKTYTHSSNITQPTSNSSTTVSKYSSSPKPVTAFKADNHTDLPPQSSTASSKDVTTDDTAVKTTALAEDVVEVTTEKLRDATEEMSSNTDADINTTDNTIKATTVEPTSRPAGDWMRVFLRTHHWSGQYFYDGGSYLFDFVVRNIHPLSSNTLVAFFYDEDGAILEMNGTSSDGHHITFVMDKVYTAGYRFPVDMQFELAGTVSGGVVLASYDGNITKPVNSSFETFHMSKGLGVVETGDTAGTRTAIIVIIPISIAFLGIIGTVTVLCWASKKGLLRGRHRAYQLFQDTPVTFESEAETIHI